MPSSVQQRAAHARTWRSPRSGPRAPPPAHASRRTRRPAARCTRTHLEIATIWSARSTTRSRIAPHTASSSALYTRDASVRAACSAAAGACFRPAARAVRAKFRSGSGGGEGGSQVCGSGGAHRGWVGAMGALGNGCGASKVPAQLRPKAPCRHTHLEHVEGNLPLARAGLAHPAPDLHPIPCRAPWDAWVQPWPQARRGFRLSHCLQTAQAHTAPERTLWYVWVQQRLQPPHVRVQLGQQQQADSGVAQRSEPHNGACREGWHRP